MVILAALGPEYNPLPWTSGYYIILCCVTWTRLRARRNPHERQFALAYLIDVEALRRSFGRIRKDAAVGVDGVTKKAYGANLEENLQGLHARLKAMKYCHQPLRRIQIPKGKGKTRPIGISSTEDKIVQGALREILEAIYEQDFRDCSHGFRPDRKAHDALRSLNRVVRSGKVNVILEADRSVRHVYVVQVMDIARGQGIEAIAFAKSGEG